MITLNVLLLLFEIIVLYHLFQNFNKSSKIIGGGSNNDENDEYGKTGLLTNLNNRNVIDNNKNIVMTVDKNINSYAENTNSKHPYLDRGRMKQIIDNIPIQNFGDNDYQKGKFTPCWDEKKNKIKKTILSETIVNILQLLLLSHLNQYTDKEYPFQVTRAEFIHFKSHNNDIHEVGFLYNLFQPEAPYGFQCIITYRLNIPFQKLSNFSNEDTKDTIHITFKEWIGIILSGQDHILDNDQGKSNYLNINRKFPEGGETTIEKGYYRTNGDTTIIDPRFSKWNTLTGGNSTTTKNWGTTENTIEPQEQCFSLNGEIFYDRVRKEDCRYGPDGNGPLGAWDKPCVNDSECPFWNSNKNYTEGMLRGGCVGSREWIERNRNKYSMDEWKNIREKGYCEMPINIKKVGYKHFLRPSINQKSSLLYEPHCYGCSDNKIGACCKKQTNPDYAFENDRTDRILAGKTV